MGYSGKYECPVDKCAFDVNVTGDRYTPSTDPNGKPSLVRGTATIGRQTLVIHGSTEHGQDWNEVGNETFRPAAPALDLG